MFQENSIETCILSRVKQITSPVWMHETSARTSCTGKTYRDRVEREFGMGIGMGNTCKSMSDSFQCMTKPTTIKKKNKTKKQTNKNNCRLIILQYFSGFPYMDMNQPWVYMCPTSLTPSHLPPHRISQDHPSALDLRTLSHASNLDW